MTRENYLDVVDDPGERVRKLATTVAAREASVRPFLDTLTEQSLMGETEAVHESLRRFRANDANLFSGLLMTLHGSETFFGEVRNRDVPDGTMDALESLEARYGHLADAFEVIYVENRFGIKNGSPGVSASRGYNAPEALPLMECEVKAKGAEVGEFRIPPSQALALADSLLTLAGWVTRDTVEDGRDIEASEVEDARERLADLEDTFEETRAIFADDGVENAKTVAPAVVEDDSDDGGQTGELAVDAEDDAEEESDTDDPTTDESYYYYH